MSSSLCNPYPELNLTYDLETDSARCNEMREKSDVAINEARANHRQCIKRLVKRIGNIDMFDEALDPYCDAKRAVQVATKNAEDTAVRLEQIKAAMSTWSYKQASVHIRNNKERLAKAERDALEKSEEIARIMSTLDPQVRAVMGNSCFHEDTVESETFAPGQLVACHCDAFGEGRSLAKLRYIAAIVISIEDGDSYRVAFNCCCDFSDLKVIRGYHLRAVANLHGW